MNADDISFEEMGAERYYEDTEDFADDSTQQSFNYTITTSAGTSTYSTSTSPVSTSTVTSPTISGTKVYGNGSVGSVGYTVVPTKPNHTFDLADMGVMQVGTFDSLGMMVGWQVNQAHPLPVQYPTFMQGQHVVSLMSGPDYHVLIRGVYSKYFTNERRAAMGLPLL